MPITFTCPHCGKETNVADQFAGQTGPCANCGQPIAIPGGGPFAAPLTETPRSPKSNSGVLILIIVLVCVMGFCVVGGLIALLLPAVQAAREAARRTQCSNNLKQIAIAMHNYHDTYKSFPPAYIADENGKPMHSWRVLILPFLEQQALYQQYNFNEPWDSPANQLVSSAVIPMFHCPSSTNMLETNYMVVTGPGTVFDADKATNMMQITDGTSNTIMAVEVEGTGVSWAEPVDIPASSFVPPWSPPGPGKPGSRHPGGVQAALCDGSVRFLSNGISPGTAQGLTTKAGGENVSIY